MDTPSLVIVGAPHFFSSTTLRPRGPRVTFTVSARLLRPRSMPRRASSSKAIIFAMGVDPPLVAWEPGSCPRRTTHATHGHVPYGPAPHSPSNVFLSLSHGEG